MIRWSNLGGARFSALIQTGHGAHPASYTMDAGSLSRGESCGGVALTIHPIQSRGWRNSRLIPFFPIWAFMAGYRAKFTFTKIISGLKWIFSVSNSTQNVEEVWKKRLEINFLSEVKYDCHWTSFHKTHAFSTMFEKNPVKDIIKPRKISATNSRVQTEQMMERHPAVFSAMRDETQFWAFNVGFLFSGTTAPSGPGPPHYSGF